jgi:hypothetical protein
MEEVKHEEKQLNDYKQLFLREYKKLKQQTESFADNHNKKREYDAISPMMQQQNSVDHKGATSAKAHN